MEDLIIEKLDAIKKTLNIIDRYLGEFNYMPFVFVISLSHFISLFWEKEFGFLGIFVGLVFDGLNYQCVRATAKFFFVESGSIIEIKGIIMLILSLVTSVLSGWFHILYYDFQWEYGAVWPVALGVFAWFNVINLAKDMSREALPVCKELSNKDRKDYKLLSSILPEYSPPGAADIDTEDDDLFPTSQQDEIEIESCPHCGKDGFASRYKRSAHVAWCQKNPNSRRRKRKSSSD